MNVIDKNTLSQEQSKAQIHSEQFHFLCAYL